MRDGETGEVTYRRGSIPGAICIIIFGILLLAAIPWLIVELQTIRDAYKLEIKTGITGLLVIGVGVYSFLVAKNTRYVLDDLGVTAYDWRNRETAHLDFKEVTSYGQQNPYGLRKSPNYVFTGGGKKLEVAVGTKNIGELYQNIKSRLPAISERAEVSTAGSLTNLLPFSDETKQFGQWKYIPVSTLVAGSGVWIVYMSIVHTPPNLEWYGMAWIALPMLGLGFYGLVLSIFERYIISPEGIRHIDWTGRVREDIAWKDVVDFIYDWMEPARRGAPPVYHYKLIGRTAHMTLNSDIPNWVMMRPMILARLPKDARVYLAQEPTFDRL